MSYYFIIFNLMSFVCHSHVIRISIVCTRMSFVFHLNVLVCHTYVTRILSLYTHMSFVIHSYVLVCHSYLLVCHPYVARMYSYIIRMSLVCTRMSFVCHSYVVLPWTVLKLCFNKIFRNIRHSIFVVCYRLFYLNQLFWNLGINFWVKICSWFIYSFLFHGRS